MKKLLCILMLAFSFVGLRASETIVFSNKAIVITKDSTTKEKISSYLIFDIAGEQVAGGTFTSTEERFPIERLCKGTYIIYVFIDNRVYKKKFAVIS